MSISRPPRVIRRWSTRLILLALAAGGPGCNASAGNEAAPGSGGSSGNPTSASGGSGGASGGNSASGGASGGNSGGASGGDSGNGGAGGASSSGGAAASGGVSGSGGGTPGDAAVDSVATTGDGGNGTGKSCAGNAVSLSANGTGMASDAAQARVLMNMMSDLPLGNAARTVEFWAYIKPTDWVGERNALYIIGPQTAPASTFGLDFGSFTVTGTTDNHATLNPVTNGGFNDDSRNDLGITSASAQWVHIAMTWDGTAVKTYVDGALKITSPGKNGITALATLDSPVSVGCNPNNKACFSGLFDEFRIWKIARSAADISANYKKALTGDEPNLVGYWKFDEAPGATMAADAVKSAGHTAHPGTLSATSPAQHPTFVTPDPPAPVMCP
jgi:hypothetical protein